MATQTQRAGGTRRRFSVDEYRRLAEVGILAEDDRVELIEGDIIEMSALGARHVACVARLNARLVPSVGDSAIILVQSPVQLGPQLEPEPDVAVVRYRRDYYSRALPTAEDVLLLVEAADTSLAYDRDVKLPLYARAGIPETWLVALNHDAIGLHTDPDPAEGRYRRVEWKHRGDVLTSVAVPSVAIAVETVLG
jgi:Uma2 family endonuclease